MANADIVLRALVEMSRKLGQPERDLVILGEGNTSALCDDGTFWVKASGTELRTITADGFVRLRIDAVRALAERTTLSDEELKEALAAARVDTDSPRLPSVETVLHALALSDGGAKFVGHTHPVAVNALTCSTAMNEAALGRLFPDEIVVLGPAPAYVPYTDPGLPLARAVRERMRRYIAEWGVPPKTILLQNHGLIALGANPQEVDSITAMSVKTCRVLAGTYAFGGPHFLSAEAARRIHTRPDEAYRRRQLKLE
ncbi:MAG TPA: aldolase [Chloroflexi bacterium]|jgi:rhamnose utilization protein RhaD (predicted bifunctional aldolase and dehydrogenase)|nr:aldolase [Chloroflexota bacterium]